jgi:hypothetical protein
LWSGTFTVLRVSKGGDAMRIAETNLSNRTKNALAKAAIVYVEDLPSVPVLRTKRGMGRIIVKEIEGLIVRLSVRSEVVQN